MGVGYDYEKEKNMRSKDVESLDSGVEGHGFSARLQGLGKGGGGDSLMRNAIA